MHRHVRFGNGAFKGLVRTSRFFVASIFLQLLQMRSHSVRPYLLLPFLFWFEATSSSKMTEVTDHACSVRLLPSHGNSCVLLNPITGESAPTPAAVGVHFDDLGKAYVEFLDEAGEATVTWADEILSNRVFANADGKLYVQRLDGREIWHHEMLASYSLKTASIQYNGEELSVAIAHLDTTRAGCYILWTLRDIQAWLGIDVGTGYKTQWVSHQWKLGNAWPAIASFRSRISLDPTRLWPSNSS